MKIFKHIYLLLLLSTLYINAQNEKSIDLNWQTDFEVAQKLASSQNKLILVYFTGSDWSQSCKRLNKDFFYTEKFQKIAIKNLILVRVNAPRRSDLISGFQENKKFKIKKTF